MTTARANPHNTGDLSTKLMYGFGAVANGAKSNGFNYLLLFFYSQVIGLPPQKVSLGIFIALMFDAVCDPWVGYFSDHLRSRWGRRHPLMYAAGIPICLTYYFLWSPPELGADAMFWYFVSMAILIRILIAFYEIPSTALVAELTQDYDQRTQFMSYRLFFAWWGGLTMAVLVYLFFLPEKLGGLEYRAGWSHYGLAASIIMFASIYISAIGTHKHIPYLVQPGVRSDTGFKAMFVEFKETLANRSFLVLFVSALFTAVAAGISTSLSIYFTRHFWELTSTQIGYLQLPYFLSAAVALFLAPMISRRIGKKRAAILITTLSVLMSPMPFILRMLGWFPENGSTALYPTLMAFFTVEVTFIIASGTLIAAMIADVVEDSEVNTGRRSEGLFFAANSLAQKAVNGLGVIVAGQLLAYVHFPLQAKLGEVPTQTLFDLARVYIPALWGFYFIAIVLMAFYRINRTIHSENLTRLAAVRERTAATAK
jgi:glycoside/pentoside/hexuronide:cation symporter, GPH family